MSESVHVDLDLDIKADRSKRARVLVDAVRNYPSYRDESIKLMKERISIMTEMHKSKQRLMVEYIEKMQEHDTLFHDIRNKENASDIQEILESVDLFEARFRDRIVDLSFVDSEILGLNGAIARGKAEIFEMLKTISLQCLDLPKNEPKSEKSIDENLAE